MSSLYAGQPSLQRNGHCQFLPVWSTESAYQEHITAGQLSSQVSVLENKKMQCSYKKYYMFNFYSFTPSLGLSMIVLIPKSVDHIKKIISLLTRVQKRCLFLNEQHGMMNHCWGVGVLTKEW